MDIRVDDSSSLTLFKAAHAQMFSARPSAYDDMLRDVSSYCGRHVGGWTSVDWFDDPDCISVEIEETRLLHHDESKTDCIRVKLRPLVGDVGEVEWKDIADAQRHEVFRGWKCSGYCELAGHSDKAGDYFSYTFSSRNRWLLKDPWGLDGIWELEYKYRSER